MNKLKVMTIIGTRPEIIRLSSCIKACDKYFNHILVHTGQNWDYTLNQVFFKDLELREPDYYLDSAGDNLGETMGNILSKSYAVMEKEQPEALLVLGDTNSSLSAICAKLYSFQLYVFINVIMQRQKHIIYSTAKVLINELCKITSGNTLKRL